MIVDIDGCVCVVNPLEMCVYFCTCCSVCVCVSEKKKGIISRALFALVQLNHILAQNLPPHAHMSNHTVVLPLRYVYTHS